MDELDQFILRTLQEDGRTPFTEMAKEAGVSETTIRTRYRNLVDAGIVRTVGIVDPRALGFQAPAIIVVSVEPGATERVARSMAELPEVSYLVMTLGSYDLIVEVFCRDQQHLADLITRQMHLMPGVRSTETLVIARARDCPPVTPEGGGPRAASGRTRAKMNERTLPLIEVKGTPRERGRQQGEGARPKILSALDRYREVIPKAIHLTWEEALREARKFLPYGEEVFPQFVKELRGIAEGAGVPFEEVWTLNCYEGLTEVRQQVWGCTCLAVRNDLTADGHVLLAHNEDWSSVDRDNVYLVRVEPNDGPPFVGMTYGPLLVNIGLNAEGIGVAIDSVYPTDGRVGVPRVLSSRAVLNTRTIGQAIRTCVPKLRAGGYSYLLADANGELYSVETSATTHDIVYGEDGWLVHTNHYLSPKMQALEEPGTYSSSHVRLNRARRLLRAQLGQVTVESLQAILRDHVNWPHSICVHEDMADPPYERESTLASLIMDLTERVMWAAPGPPCEGEYSAYCLDGGSQPGIAPR